MGPDAGICFVSPIAHHFISRSSQHLAKDSRRHAGRTRSGRCRRNRGRHLCACPPAPQRRAHRRRPIVPREALPKQPVLYSARDHLPPRAGANREADCHGRRARLASPGRDVPDRQCATQQAGSLFADSEQFRRSEHRTSPCSSMRLSIGRGRPKLSPAEWCTGPLADGRGVRM
jgi:hypothetical protein